MKEYSPASIEAKDKLYKKQYKTLIVPSVPLGMFLHLIKALYMILDNDFTILQENKPFKDGDITIAGWIGEFKPERINVIPLFEDMQHMLEAHNITKEYLRDKKVKYQRVFLARSDPAMNYGLVSAVLLNKIALQRLQRLSEEIGIKIYPIVGAGSAPFRGNLRPQTIERVAKEYLSAHTFTIQSAFKYDNHPEEVREAIRKLREREPGVPQQIDEERCLEIIKKYSREYQRQITALAPIINKVAKYVPRRRKRKLHIGLFGYSRDIKGITLPRAITFTAALYSIGLPPEILGLNALDEDDLQFIKEVYVNFEDDLKDALKFYNPDTIFLPKGLEATVREVLSDFQIDEEHKEIT
ncbi:MAG TPA: phosphoenolpyruvate carboxylase, partial [Candidatus Atribacteria bacterium]|nr:phosphoenolpyruvate carboxylase [Candidatus Atribacteria bacterium]